MLRVLLALALMANGTSSVFAATRMQVESFGARIAVVDGTQSDASTAAAPCDEHAGMDALAMDPSAMTPHMGGDAPDSGGESGDCCKAAQCVCACVLHAVAGMANVHVMEPLIDRDTTAQVLGTGHAAPPLPHLIRPPIG